MHTRSIFLSLFASICLFSGDAIAQVSLASQNIATPFGWQTWTSGTKEWGDVYPEIGIPTANHTAKLEIKNVVDQCGIGLTNYNLIRSYKIDFTGDGVLDFVLDPSAYFAQGVSATCPLTMNGASGHLMALYRYDSATQTITEPPMVPNPAYVAPAPILIGATATPAAPVVPQFIQAICPATAAANTNCYSYCPATVAQCPQLFTYNLPPLSGTNNPVLDWAFISSSTFSSFQSVTVSPQTSLHLYHTAYNSNPVYKFRADPSKCNYEEMQVNGGYCIKYYQYVAGSVNGFIDLYSPTTYPSSIDNDTRVTTNVSLPANPPFNQSSAQIEVSPASSWRTQGVPLNANTATSFQIQNFSGQPICRIYTNTSSNSYFIPTKTDYELQSFITAAQSGNLAGVTSSECLRKFTSWVGPTQCSQVSIPCGTQVTIAAERRCQRSSSAFANCSECASITDPAVVVDNTGVSHANQCYVSQVCDGGSCPSSGDCLPGEAKILMADGSEKRVDEVKAGDMIKAFKGKAASAKLTTAKVKAVSVTDKRGVVSINGIKMTDGHLVLLSKGRTTTAGSLKVGNKIVGANGKLIKITKLEPESEPVVVYNFEVEGMDGYVANGLRVMALKSSGE
ncbi:MAG: Hint domain-containing protein [Alphaproteobacteria bacterium]|nr:Hint domain-containing protein [Alphaproteobacteria bacterium]